VIRLLSHHRKLLPRWKRDPQKGMNAKTGICASRRSDELKTFFHMKQIKNQPFYLAATRKLLW